MTEKSWFQKNKKWFLPTVIVVPLLFVGFVFLIISFVMGLMKDSSAYKMTMETIKTNSECITQLGEPIEEGFFVTGNVSTTNNNGSANLQIPLKGSLNNGTAYVVCEKNSGKWEIMNLDVKIGSQLLDIK